MSKKINPISFRNGVFKTWSIDLQKYGKYFKFYSILFYSKLYVLRYIERYFLINDFSIDYLYWVFANKEVFINVVFFENSMSRNTNIVKKMIDYQFLKTLSYWFPFPVTFFLYNKLYWYNSASLISEYICKCLQNDFNTKKILHNVYKIALNQLNFNKIIYTKNGLKIVFIKGFRIQFSGCFDSSRTQLSKSIKYSYGSLPLSQLQNYIEYSFSQVFTKYGICGLKIWVFYKVD